MPMLLQGNKRNSAKHIQALQENILHVYPSVAKKSCAYDAVVRNGMSHLRNNMSAGGIQQLGRNDRVAFTQ